MAKAKLVIIGSGPAGYTAAIYSARANLAPVMFEGFFSGPAGGQLMTTTDVENYPGFPDGISGPELMQSFRKQAERFGTSFLTEDVIDLDLSSRPFKVIGKKNTLETDSIIISTGATAKRLDVPGTRDGELWQKGVTACAVCDGAMPIFRNKPLYVIGGGDTAVEEALFLTKYGSEVFIVHRRDELRASKIMADRALKHPKLRILWNKTLEEVTGDKVVGKVSLKDTVTGEVSEHEAGGVFYAIGHEPNTSFIKDHIDLQDNGYIKLSEPGTSRTSVEGIFSAGDVHDHVYRQAVTAAGSGCMAALEAERWLAEQGLVD